MVLYIEPRCKLGSFQHNYVAAASSLLEPRSVSNRLHDHTAVLLQLPQKPRQNLVVLALVLLRLVMGLVMLSPMLSSVMSPVMSPRWQRLSTLEVDDYPADIVLIGAVLQPKLLAQFLDLGLDPRNAAA
ncbi:hypothetical protein NM208_g15362 [Fusarium decemcellulare]|uniref:Uncharacterized protein n=1 Tax=Fusarium decemcellulare TaxID=57161 RepID=A0ACC1RGN6_9HYPO|nr:hypothetical protein NM208_g15362 [Fusarium decemcellulare]